MENHLTRRATRKRGLARQNRSPATRTADGIPPCSACAAVPQMAMGRSPRSVLSSA
jgi:hypothetical protein